MLYFYKSSTMVFTGRPFNVNLSFSATKKVYWRMEVILVKFPCGIQNHQLSNNPSTPFPFFTCHLSTQWAYKIRILWVDQTLPFFLHIYLYTMNFQPQLYSLLYSILHSSVFHPIPTICRLQYVVWLQTIKNMQNSSVSHH